MKPVQSIRRAAKALHMLLSDRYDYAVRYVYAKMCGISARLRKPETPQRTILFYPQRPRSYHSANAVCHQLGYKIVHNPNTPADIAIRFEDETFSSCPDIKKVIRQNIPIINERCVDISKVRVEEAFEKTFGYGMKIDPRTHTGVCVRKSNDNAKHDGLIVECPSEPEPGYIYQRLIDNQVSDTETRDIRAIILGDTIPYARYRYHGMDDRFNTTLHSHMVASNEEFSAEEQRLILSFCKEMGFDYGDLDILRDNTDGKIYIVDANNTPGGPSMGSHEGRVDFISLIRDLRPVFSNFIESRIKSY